MKNEYNSFKANYKETINRVNESLEAHFRESFKYVMNQLPKRVHNKNDRNLEIIDGVDTNLMIISKQVREELIRSCDEVSMVSRGLFPATSSLQYEQYNLDTLIFGDLKMDETISKESIETEMHGRETLNEYIGKKVYGVENFIYITPIFMYDINMVNFFKTYKMEYNALFIRYASRLKDDDFDLLMDTLKVVITERVAKIHTSLPTLTKLLLDAGVVVNEYKTDNDPFMLYTTLLIGKLVMDSVNEITTNNDSKSMVDIIGLAKMNMKNSGFYDGVRKADSAIRTFLQLRLNEHPRFIENAMNIVVNETTKKKFNLVTSHNQIQVKDSIDKWAIMKSVVNGNVREYGVESIGPLPNISPMAEIGEELAQYSDKIFSPYGIYGMENYDGDALDKYKRKSRAELLGMIVENKKRKRYLSLEADITRYKSDLLNCNDDVKKNVLLKRSETLSKLINIETDNSKGDDILVELYVLLEDVRFELDGKLSSRDFKRERNSRLYGQVKSGGVWDY